MKVSLVHFNSISIFAISNVISWVYKISNIMPTLLISPSSLPHHHPTQIIFLITLHTPQHHERVEPSACLVQSFGNEVGRKGLFKELDNKFRMKRLLLVLVPQRSQTGSGAVHTACNHFQTSSQTLQTLSSEVPVVHRQLYQPPLPPLAPPLPPPPPPRPPPTCPGRDEGIVTSSTNSLWRSDREWFDSRWSSSADPTHTISSQSSLCLRDPQSSGGEREGEQIRER